MLSTFSSSGTRTKQRRDQKTWCCVNGTGTKTGPLSQQQHRCRPFAITYIPHFNNNNMVRRLFITFGAVASLLAMPCTFAQFGVAGGARKKATTSFEALNEMAKKQQQEGGGAGAGAMDGLPGLGNLEEMQKWMNDPEMKQAMEDAMEELAKMSPEQMQEQMQQALGMLTDTGMVDTIMEKKDEVLQQLESSGLVSEQDLQKYKENPEAFEKEMREAFGQMQKIFSDGDVLKEALQSMADPLMKQVSELMQGDLSDDIKIEEVRLELLSKPEVFESNPLLGSLFESEEFKDALGSEEKWREAVKKGQQMFMDAAAAQGGGVGVGAGVGEL